MVYVPGVQLSFFMEYASYHPIPDPCYIELSNSMYTYRRWQSRPIEAKHVYVNKSIQSSCCDNMISSLMQPDRS